MKIRKIISLFVLVAMLMTTSKPALAASQEAATNEKALTVGNQYINITVNKKNGGFYINTVEGDVLKKSDDNKSLLYRSDDFDTSFTTFRVEEEGSQAKDYIFGSKYGFLGTATSDVVSTKDDTGVTSIWSVGDIKVTQHLTLANITNGETSGTVQIGYTVENTGNKVLKVDVRALMDTMLDNKDCALYELKKPGQGNGYRQIEQETTVTNDDVPASFFACNDSFSPTVAAYSINEKLPDVKKPYQITFAHWNNLAATVFDYTVPKEPIYFTNEYNQYKTADSAQALYFHLDTLNPGEKKNLSTYYGVTSNFNKTPADRLVMNSVSPTRIELDESKTDENGNQTGEYKNNGMFNVSTSIANTMDDAVKWNKVAVAVYTDNGLLACNTFGDFSYTNERPYQQQIIDFEKDQTKTLTWSMKAIPQKRTGFQKIIFKAYDMSKRDDGLLLDDNVIAETSTSILVPASVNGLQPIQFTSSTPDIIYYNGKRCINITGYGFNIFKSKPGGWTLKAVSKSDPFAEYAVPAENINISDDEHIIVTLMDNMDLGDYDFEFDWTISDNDLKVLGLDKTIKASALKFIVSDNPKYKALSYGIITVERVDNKRNYGINTFADENAMNNYYNSNADIVTDGRRLLILKGDFSKPFTTATTGQPDEIYSASGKTTTVTINGVLDFKGENISVKKSDGSVEVKMDGQLLTSGSGTSVWSGLSEIEMKSDKMYSLVQYDENGNRVSEEPDALQGEELLQLKWADNYGFLQTIGGFAINLKFGVFGNTVLKDYKGKVEKVLGNTLSFGGSLDLSFMTPGGAQKAKVQANPPMKTVHNALATETIEDDYDDSKVVKPSVSMSVDDVLFGQHNNKVGFMGVKASAEVTMPTIVKALPGKAEGKVDINTIGKYEVGVAGGMEWETFNMNFELRVKQAPNSGAPIPDKLLFTIGGFEPGINIDTLGGIWITGGGGGIDNLYDTIYSKGGLPPLTIMLQVQFDIAKAMSSKAELELSARSFNLALDDVAIKGTEIQILKGGNVGFTWYPGFSMKLGANMEFLKIINGSINLSANQSAFMFLAQAAISLPEYIPIVGGMEVASAELGGNMDKIWGQLKLLFLSMGITYYWGDSSVVFGASVGDAGSYYTASTQMLKVETPIPVAYDKNTNKTLYMVVGNNLQRIAVSGNDRTLTQEEIDNFKNSTAASKKMLKSALELTAPSNPTIKSNDNMSSHILDMGSVPGNYLLTIEGIGDELPLDIADRLTITSPDGKPYIVNYYENGKDAATVTGNKILNKDKDKISGLYISIPEKDYQPGSWLLQADRPVLVTITKALPVPELSTAAASVDTSDNTLNVSWDGTDLDDTSKVSVFVASDKNAVGIGIGDTYKATDKGAKVAIPDSITSGNYYVRAILQKDNSSFQSMYANGETALAYVNPNAPQKPSSAVMEGAGNGMAKITAAAASDIDGYSVDVLEKLQDGKWGATAQTGIMFGKDDEMLIGGSYSALDSQGNNNVQGGLQPDKTYIVLVRAYKNGTDGKPHYFSNAETTNEFLIPAYTAPVIQMTAEGSNVKKDEDTFIFNSNDVKLKLTSGTDVTGTWIVDSTVGDKCETAGKEVSFNASLGDGEHIIEFDGREKDDKDSFVQTQKIIVDTAPPKLMMQSPINGALYTNGQININAIVDRGSLFTIKVDGETKIDNKNLDEFIDKDDMLKYALPVGTDKLSKTVEITETDEAGNKTVFQSVINNGDLGQIRRIYIAQNGEPVGGNGISVDANSLSAKIDAIGVTKDGKKITLTGEKNLKWNTGGNTGNISIDGNGYLTVLSEGNAYVEAAYELSNDAAYTDSVTVAMAETAAPTITTDPVYVTAVPNDSTVTVTLTTSTEGADIYYTTDGSEPTTASQKYTGAFNVTAGTKEAVTRTIKAIAVKTGMSDSHVSRKAIAFAAKAAPISGGGGGNGDSSTNNPVPNPEVQATRLYGKSRMDTAVAISKAGWTTSDSVILANAYNFPDAMAGTTFAYSKKAPILLTAKDSIDDATMNEIARLKAKNIYILGGSGVISDDILDNLKSNNYNVQRIFGSDRYKTAVEIGKYIKTDTVVIATGDNFPDALAIGPYAASHGYPILFTSKDSLNEDTKLALESLHTQKAIIVGGRGVVSQSVEEKIKGMNIDVERLGGDNRYLTALEIIKKFTVGTTVKGITIATGENFPDALTGGPFAAQNGYPIFLTGSDDMNLEVLEFIKDLKLSDNVYILGGSDVVSDDIKKKLYTK